MSEKNNTPRDYVLELAEEASNILNLAVQALVELERDPREALKLMREAAGSSIERRLRAALTAVAPAPTVPPQGEGIFTMEDMTEAIRTMPHGQAIEMLMTGASEEDWKKLAGMAVTLQMKPEQFVWDPAKAQSTTASATPPPETRTWQRERADAIAFFKRQNSRWVVEALERGDHEGAAATR